MPFALPASTAVPPGSVIDVESLALGPASASLAAGRPPHLYAAVLYCSHRLGGGSRVRHVACLEVGEGQELRSCAWFHRCAPCIGRAAPAPPQPTASRQDLQLRPGCS